MSLNREVVVWAHWKKYDKTWAYKLTDDVELDMTTQGWVKVATKEVSLDPLDEATTRKQVVEGLKGKIKDIQAQAYVAQQQVEQDIQEMLALPSSVEET